MKQKSKPKSGSKSNSSISLLHNVYVLYSVFLASLVFIVHCLWKRNFYVVAVFFLTAVVTFMFDKNLIVVAGAGLCMSAIYIAVQRFLRGKKEGFSESDMPLDYQAKSPAEKKAYWEKECARDPTSNVCNPTFCQTNPTDAFCDSSFCLLYPEHPSCRKQSGASASVEGFKSGKRGDRNQSKYGNNDSDSDSDSDDNGGGGGGGSGGGRTNNAAQPHQESISKPVIPRRAPAKKVKPPRVSVGSDNDDSDSDAEPVPSTDTASKWKKNRKNNNTPKLDYASTIKANYEDLNHLLGKDGIENLTNQTKDLLQQQTELAKAMQGISPLMNNANKLLKNFKGMDGMKELNVF